MDFTGVLFCGGALLSLFGFSLVVINVRRAKLKGGSPVMECGAEQG
jgi:hypothetical protein